MVVYDKNRQKLSYLVELSRIGIDVVEEEQKIIDSVSLPFNNLPSQSFPSTKLVPNDNNLNLFTKPSTTAIKPQTSFEEKMPTLKMSKKIKKNLKNLINYSKNNNKVKPKKQKGPRVKMSKAFRPPKVKKVKTKKVKAKKVPLRRRKKDFFAESEGDSFMEFEEDFSITIPYEEALQMVIPRSQNKTKSSYALDNQKEEQYRKLFANDRNNYILDDKYLMLIDVFENHNQFVFKAPNLPDDVPLLLKRDDNSNINLGSRSIVDKSQFFSNWENFTNNVFQNFDFSNIFIAGGSVNACLDENYSRNKYTNDLDLFIYDLSPHQATEKLKYIYQKIKSNTSSDCQIIRTKNAVTILGAYPYRHVQIILRIYKVIFFFFFLFYFCFNFLFFRVQVKF